MRRRNQVIARAESLPEAKALEEQAKIIRTAQVELLSPKETSAQPASRIGGDVLAPGMLKKVEPEYSIEGRVAKWQGTVILQIAIGVDGRAYNMHLIKSLGMGLDEAAVDAVGHWEFVPGSAYGTPVPVLATIQVNFRLL